MSFGPKIGDLFLAFSSLYTGLKEARGRSEDHDPRQGDARRPPGHRTYGCRCTHRMHRGVLRLYPDVHLLRRRLPRRGYGRAHEALCDHVPQLLGRLRSSPGRRRPSRRWSGPLFRLAPRRAGCVARSASITPRRWTWSTAGCAPRHVGAVKMPAQARSLPSARKNVRSMIRSEHLGSGPTPGNRQRVPAGRCAAA